MNKKFFAERERILNKMAVWWKNFTNGHLTVKIVWLKFLIYNFNCFVINIISNKVSFESLNMTYNIHERKNFEPLRNNS